MIGKLSNIRYFPAFLFVFSFALYASNIGGISIYILDEAKNAGCAREMYEKGDLIVPVFNDVLRPDKPPLHYFFMALSYSIFGVSAFAARFFSAVFGAGTILITYLFTRKFAGKEMGGWTSIILLSSIHLSIQFHLAVPDPYLVFFMTSGLMAFYVAIKENNSGFLFSAYAAIGLGTLTKGPVAIVLPGLAVLFFLTFTKRFRWKNIIGLKPLWGAFIILLIALPWYIMVHLKTNGAWTEGFFVRHNFERFTGAMEGHGGTFLITILFVLAGMFPFSVFIVQAIKKAWKNRSDDFTLFSLTATFAIIMFFAFSSTRLPNYTVPAYPFLAILLAMYLQNINAGNLKLKAAMITLLTVGIIIIPGIFIALRLDPALAPVNHIAFYFLPLPAILIMAYYFWMKKRWEAAMVSIACSGMATALIFFLFAFPVIDKQNPVHKSLYLLEGKEVRYFKKFNSSYSFYLKKTIPPIEESAFGEFFREHPDGVIISTTKYIEQIDMPQYLKISFSSRDILETPTTVLIRKSGNQ